MEAIIESVDEFYGENLARDVVRGMREAASSGFFLASHAPFGYKGWSEQVACRAQFAWMRMRERG